ncbi:hypothetical protein TNCT_490391 [Trichonephila clavata]|uniref:Uncharacterized protein n=1 Tax=Trichonephila clavata TaxID=2740835 RepID=A0A8X6G4Z3_TRICU|nr:hypothetical protein TNCT_490391 [Trichonephila clavata]
MSLNELLCFVEDTFQCILQAHGLDWHPVAINGHVQRFFTPAIGSTLLETKKYCIGHPSPTHLKYVVKLMSSSPGGCQNYIFLVGQHYFKEKVFTWHDFRVFLAFIGEVAVYTFREEGILLIDDIVLNTTLYVKDYLQYWIDQLGGWTAFQLDCVRNVLHLALSINTQAFYEVCKKVH